MAMACRELNVNVICQANAVGLISLGPVGFLVTHVASCLPGMTPLDYDSQAQNSTTWQLVT